jgi:hypothetical protein
MPPVILAMRKRRQSKLGQYLFLRHGTNFFGRFVAIPRILAAFLAGANQIPSPSISDRFLEPLDVARATCPPKRKNSNSSSRTRRRPRGRFP